MKWGNHPLRPNYLTALVVSGVVVNLSPECVHVCPLAALRHRDLSHGIPTVYLDLSSDYRGALSLGIISCQEQLLLNAADNSQTCCSICTAAYRKNTYIKPGNIAGVKCGPSTYISVFLFEIPASKSCISTILSDNLKLFWSALLISVSS